MTGRHAAGTPEKKLKQLSQAVDISGKKFDYCFYKLRTQPAGRTRQKNRAAKKNLKLRTCIR